MGQQLGARHEKNRDRNESLNPQPFDALLLSRHVAHCSTGPAVNFLLTSTEERLHYRYRRNLPERRPAMNSLPIALIVWHRNTGGEAFSALPNAPVIEDVERRFVAPPGRAQPQPACSIASGTRSLPSGRCAASRTLG